MKKSIAFYLMILFFAFFLIAGALWIYKHGFGHIEKGAKPFYPHAYNEIFMTVKSDVIKLDDDNILFVGGRKHNCENSKDYNEIPFEIYNSDKNEIAEEFGLPKDLMYAPHAVLLKNNKILLVNAYEEKDAICTEEFTKFWHSFHPAQYDSMILYNLDKKKVEKVIKKKIIKMYGNVSNHDENILGYTTLNNGIVLLFDSYNGIIERFDLESGTSELITNLDVEYRKNSKILPYKKDKALIFHTDIKIYDDLTKTVKPYKTIKENDDYLIENPKFINENEIYFVLNDNNEIYNLETEKLYDFAQYKSVFKSDSIIDAIEINDRYVLIFQNLKVFWLDEIIRLFILDRKENKLHKLQRIRTTKWPIIKTIKLNNGNIFIYNCLYGGIIHIFKPGFITKRIR